MELGRAVVRINSDKIDMRGVTMRSTRECLRGGG